MRFWKKNLKTIAAAGAALSPLTVLAQGVSLQRLLDVFGGIVWRLLPPLLFSLALLFFFWGAAVFILNADNEEKRKEGKQRMFWGVVALFVIFSIWGIIVLLGRLVGIYPGVGP